MIISPIIRVLKVAFQGKTWKWASEFGNVVGCWRPSLAQGTCPIYNTPMPRHCPHVLQNESVHRVGHIFRSFHPYTFPGNKDTHGINTARTVEVLKFGKDASFVKRWMQVWMDDFKRLFYMHRPDLLNSDIGSVTNRLKFKQVRLQTWALWNLQIFNSQDLQCKPFSWFLKNVYPEKFILDDPKHVFAYGRLKNPTSNTCLDNLQV